MFNLYEGHTSLKTLATNDTYHNLNCASSLAEVRSENLNLWKVRMAPLYFCL